jgi:micrococcal nuclease
MKKNFLPLVLLVSLTGCDIASRFELENEAHAAVTQAQQRTHFDTVTRVIDGDTVAIRAEWNPYPNIEWRIRMAGIDTPEKGARASCARERELGTRAHQMTEQLVQQTLGRVRLRNVKHDKYGGRLVADVIMADGRSMSDELLKAGMAKRYNGSGPKPNWC